ncbi:MAG: cytochrome c oxidase assembly protein [Alphaproteobacteria bacterium]|nr:cytochrome c oxidase assembly protein [Alphaproteobacteria bacterium]
MKKQYKNPRSDLAQKNARLLKYVFLIVFAMIGLAYTSVPLYNIFCRVTGWGGTTQIAEALPAPEEIIDRTVTVRFDANTARDLPWTFKPELQSIDVKLGERGFINFIAGNKLNNPSAGTAVFNVTPLKAGKYFHKIQCFCFDEQILQAGQTVNMPVLFYVDPAMHADKNLDDVTVITLSYSFFPTDSEDLQAALEEFYETQTVPNTQ